MRSLTKEEFIFRAKEIHGNKYDYSKIEYVNYKFKVCIICPIHGEFWQSPKTHIHGSGCQKCAANDKKKKIFGVGINDCEFSSNKKFAIVWRDMIQRCYDSNFISINPTYLGCSVCDEWLYLSNFKEWFDKNYIEGYQLDKDILVKGNKVYSPETCCFVPREINYLFIKNTKIRTNVRASRSKYRADIKIRKKYINIGSFDTKEEAEEAYAKTRINLIKQYAEEYYNANKITFKVYHAMMNYKYIQ